jgi:hypothetical protein
LKEVRRVGKGVRVVGRRLGGAGRDWVWVGFGVGFGFRLGVVFCHLTVKG